MNPATPHRHQFRAMGTGIEFVAAQSSSARAFLDAAKTIEQIFEEEEQRFSRFRLSSELSFVNARAGGWTRVSPAFAEVTRIALRGAEETGGLFDPGVLPALLHAGYDRDFSLIGDAPAAFAHSPSAEYVPGSWRDIELAGNRLRLPAGTGLDFGGIAKGWTVDRAANEAVHLPWALVSAGGDLRVVGSDIPTAGIEIAIEDPMDRAASVMNVRLEAGALASSSIEGRSWGSGMHHLIDPRTGRPTDRNVVQATAWADTCVEAEIAAKWALLGGPVVLERVSAVLVMQSGDLFTNLDGVVAERPSA